MHLGKGSTIGSVIPTKGAIIPAAVGVDIGCGMMACKTTLGASDLPDNLGPLRAAIEKAVPHGMSPRRGGRDKGSWAMRPTQVDALWAELAPGFERITQKYPRLKNTNNYRHLGTLGTGNHFIEVCLDETVPDGKKLEPLVLVEQCFDGKNIDQRILRDNMLGHLIPAFFWRHLVISNNERAR